MSVFDRFFGKGRDVRAAHRAELRGDLEKAVELYGLAGVPEEAARVMIIRGDAESDTRIRMRHFTQAVATAPEGHPVREEARRKRAALLVAQFGAGALSETARRELRSAGAELLAVGDAADAAEAFHLAGDAEGEAKALAQAGDVESLELLLTSQQKKERGERLRTATHGQIDVLFESGRRREALTAAEGWLATHDDDVALRDRASMIKARRALGPIAQVWLRGKALALVLGDVIVIGRTEGTLRIASQAVSRQHLRIERTGETVTVRDLGTRNGTQLRGIALAAAITVPEAGIELTLGKEVRVRVAPSSLLEGAVVVEIGGDSYVAPLGRARIPGVPWELDAGPDSWIELVANGIAPFLGDVSLGERTTLLVGDAITSERGGPEVLRVVVE